MQATQQACKTLHDAAALCALHVRLQDQCKKLREEREGALRDLAVLRCDVEAGRSERERLAAELKEAREELDK